MTWRAWTVLGMLGACGPTQSELAVRTEVVEPSDHPRPPATAIATHEARSDRGASSDRTLRFCVVDGAHGHRFLRVAFEPSATEAIACTLTNGGTQAPLRAVTRLDIELGVGGASYAPAAACPLPASVEPTPEGGRYPAAISLLAPDTMVSVWANGVEVGSLATDERGSAQAGACFETLASRLGW